MPRTASWPADGTWFVAAALDDYPGMSSAGIARLWASCSGHGPLPERRTRIEVARLKGCPPARRRHSHAPAWLRAIQAAVRAEGLAEARSRRGGAPYVGRSAWRIVRQYEPTATNVMGRPSAVASRERIAHRLAVGLVGA